MSCRIEDLASNKMLGSLDEVYSAMIRLDNAHQQMNSSFLDAPGGFAWWYLEILDHQGMDAIADCCVDFELHSRDVSVWIHMG